MGGACPTSKETVMGLNTRTGMTRRYRRVMGAVMAALALALMLAAGTAGRAQAATLLSQGMPTTASSTESAA
jgi:TRAP-type C4-dicarboxylate transport system permease small subunit